MAALSNAHATALINSSLRSGTVYLGLFVSNPGAGASGGTEVSGGSYARRAVTMGPPSVVNSVSTSTNTAAINFPTATATWGEVSYWAIFDASTGGNKLWFGPFTRSKDVDTNDSVTIPVGELKVTLS